MQIFVKKTGTTGSTVTLNIAQDATVDQLFKLVDKEISPDGDYSLIFSTKNLDGSRQKTLADLEIKSKSTLLLIYRVHGGRNPEQEAALVAALNQQKTGLRPLPGLVTLSVEDCMITICAPGPGEMHAKMMCGHVISPQGMTGHALSIVQEGRYQFFCPTCKRDWPFHVVEHVGCFTDDEKREVHTKLAENYTEKAMGVQKCPTCSSYCMREDENNLCAVCPVCTKKNGKPFEFCWSCMHEWANSSDYKKCGNSGCDGRDSRNRYLAECGEKQVEYSGVKCPSVRACPKCHVLINHVDGCKQMKCIVTKCMTEFCFVCLKMRVDGKWQCGEYNNPCVKAPVQQF